MSPRPRVTDPYRELGVARGADEDQIKAAHRRLAKRHHPDAPGGDTKRFLAIHEAYQLLSDPLRRREWDRRHAPGPVQAGDAASRRARPAGRWTREEGEPVRPPRSSRPARPADARPGAPPNASDRDPASRSHTWTADSVPWWEDFSPRAERRGAGDGPRATRPPGPGSRARATDDAGRQETGPPQAGRQEQRRPDFDVYSRSSGAAWSMAARRHFRRGDADLPKGGEFRYRGTQVVTGAEARRLAAEEELLRRRSTPAAPRQAFDHDPAPRAGPAPHRPPAPADPVPADPAPHRPPAPAPAPADPAPPSGKNQAPAGSGPAPARAAPRAPAAPPGVAPVRAAPPGPAAPPGIPARRAAAAAGAGARVRRIRGRPLRTRSRLHAPGRPARLAALAGALPGLSLATLAVAAEASALLYAGLGLGVLGGIAGALLGPWLMGSRS
jgi:curved DNA-binding protein CbpA